MNKIIARVCLLAFIFGIVTHVYAADASDSDASDLEPGTPRTRVVSQVVVPVIEIGIVAANDLYRSMNQEQQKVVRAIMWSTASVVCGFASIGCFVEACDTHRRKDVRYAFAGGGFVSGGAAAICGYNAKCELDAD